MDGDAATGTDVGLIPTKTTIATNQVMNAADNWRRYWQPGTSEPLGQRIQMRTGCVLLVQEPVTPGDPFYKFRDILSHHAHRFVVEHNPSNLRYTNTDERRIEHLSHELSNQDRMRAGNVSSLVRPNIGHLWERIHKFVLIPAEEDWKTERDALKVLIEEHLCAVCEGAGLSYRLMADHPREEWKGWLDAELRFTVDRELERQPHEWEGGHA